MIAAASAPANAQMDSWMLDQWLNQMNMDVIQQQQQLGRQFQELVEAETQRQADMASATCIMLPNGNDTFFGYITFLYLSKDKVELTMTDASGRNTVLPSSDYFYTFGKMLTPAGDSTSCKFKHFFSFLLLMNLIYILSVINKRSGLLRAAPII